MKVTELKSYLKSNRQFMAGNNNLFVERKTQVYPQSYEAVLTIQPLEGLRGHLSGGLREDTGAERKVGVNGREKGQLPSSVLSVSVNDPDWSV